MLLGNSIRPCFRLDGRFAVARIGAPMPILNFLLVLAQLLLQPMHYGVYRGHQAARLVVRHKVVLVLGRDLDVDAGIFFVLQVDNDFDGGEPLENSQQFFGLGGDALLASVT